MATHLRKLGESARAELIGHALEYPGDRWTCPRTGVVVAKDVDGNLAQRRKVLERCAFDAEYQARVEAICSRSFLVWLNLFGWTYVVVEVDAGGKRLSKAKGEDRLFITWPVQDAMADVLEECLASGESLVITKSREMGGSWLILAFFAWCCKYRPKWQGRVLSRKEELVDDADDNPDTLLWKHDYLLEHLPEWMRPRQGKKLLHRGYPDTGSAVIGESTNANAGRAGRGQAMFVDEAAAIDNLRSVDRSTQDTTPCRIYLSTTVMGSYFSMLVRSGKIRVFRLMWWDHPDKGRGRRMVRNELTGEMEFTSPYYEAEVAKRVDAQDVAENLNADDAPDSMTVFDSRTIDVQMARYGRPPLHRGLLGYEEGVAVDEDLPANREPTERLAFLPHERGSWRLWCDLVSDRDGRLRPAQDRAYVFGIDVSLGTGASNSVISVWDADSGVKVGRFSNSRVFPRDFAGIIYRASKWWGGRRSIGSRPMLVIENNGPGEQQLIPILLRMGGLWLYRHVDPLKVSERPSETYGWVSGRRQKKAQLGTYRGRLARCEIINPDKEALEEHRQYVNYPEGGCGPLVHAQQTDEARAPHGDMVIGDMLGDLGVARMPTEVRREPEPPPTSAAARMKRRREQVTREGEDE